MRVTYADLGDDRPGRLFIAVHHLAVDGVSWSIPARSRNGLPPKHGRQADPPAGESNRLPSRRDAASGVARLSGGESEILYWRGAAASLETAPALPADALTPGPNRRKCFRPGNLSLRRGDPGTASAGPRGLSDAH